MPELQDLYQQIILEHNKNPRNYRELPNATRKVDGYNPLCGDHYTVFLELDGETIKDIGFTGSGCAISKASASVMSTTVKGKTREEAERYFDTFHRLVTGDSTGLSTEELGRLAAFSGVSEFPARVKCASLAWHTLRTALENEAKEVVTTE
ncbi:MAG TPA: SUF system NifU family Fe-S cluster assembly protein [Thermoanaerobaculia bacterium]|jgi:nitrogen fixation protein NifU and related proteins|nr:SUF system NifU family Fe-S cluster assembly protein [Thermoanaerobaculia bacterium]